jgi:hypothetical protein
MEGNNSNVELENSRNLVNVNSIDGYTILGHGNNGHGKIIVPEGSIVVAKAHPGDDIAGLEETLLKEKKKILNIKHIQTILNPLNNAKNLYKLFGSVSIFRGGQTCPNFQYSLIAIHPRDRNSCIIKTSGIIKIPVANLKSLDNNYKFDLDMTVGMYKRNDFKIGSLFKFCDNSVLKLDTIDSSKKKSIADKLELYNTILRHIDEFKPTIIKDNKDDLLIMIGIRKDTEMRVIPKLNKYDSVYEELKKVFKARFDSQPKNYKNFYTTRNSKMSLETYIDEFKESIPAIITSLESDIQGLNRTIEEYVDDYISSQQDNEKLINVIFSLKRMLYITQSTIFENSLKPSITYNFVCRTNANSQKGYNANLGMMTHRIRNNQRNYTRSNGNINRRIKNGRNLLRLEMPTKTEMNDAMVFDINSLPNEPLRRNTRKLIGPGRLGLVESVANQISEAELQRKGQIRNASNLLYRKNADEA